MLHIGIIVILCLKQTIVINQYQYDDNYSDHDLVVLYRKTIVEWGVGGSWGTRAQGKVAIHQAWNMLIFSKFLHVPKFHKQRGSFQELVEICLDFSLQYKTMDCGHQQEPM